MLFQTLSLLSLLASVSAIDVSNWSPAGPGDSRSPCPALNTLANHGILPHDGKSLSVPTLVKALGDAYNIAPDLATFLSVGGLLSSPNPLGLTLDLADLDKHNFIEHDASLSRADYNQGGDDHTFSPSTFSSFLTGFAGLDNTTLESAAKSRFARVSSESKSDSQFTYTPQQFVLSYGESALYLYGLGNSTTDVPLSWMQTWFAKEQLPYSQGWRTSSRQIGFSQLTVLISKLITAADDELPEGLILTESTLARALLGLDVLETDISPLIQGLLNQFGLGGVL